MANLVDDSGSVNSNLVSGKGTNTATFPMPGNVALQVESVVATVNNAAGADTGATLVVKDQSGVVIATKRQGAVIPAGDTGTMTWALRLADESEAVALTHPIGFYDVQPVGGNPWGAGSTLHALDLSFGGTGAGEDLLDLTTYGPSAPLPLIAGMYEVTARLFFTPGAGGTFAANTFARLDLLVANDYAPQDQYQQESSITFPLVNSFGQAVASAGWSRYFDPALTTGIIPEPAFFEVDVYKPSALSLNVFGQVSVQRLY